jgi:hypothetical protein
LIGKEEMYADCGTDQIRQINEELAGDRREENCLPKSAIECVLDYT